jgi:rubrerythrin
MSGIKATVRDVNKTDERPPDTPTLKFLGTDKHAKKIIEGKFSSNVAPKNAGKGKVRPETWECSACGHTNRDYHATCFECNARTRPF